MRLARKLHRGTRFTAHEVAEIRALRRHVGIRRAVAARVRVNLELDAVPGRVDELAARVQRIEVENGCFGTEVGSLRADAERLAAHNGQVGAEVESLRTEVERLADELDRTRLQAERTERILSSEAWLAAVPRSQSLISVVTPTHDRATLLPRAIASVQAQTHAHWEMIIVDDHSTDETPNVLASLEDPRIRSFSARARGSIPARNQALAVATGEIIVYLDDDNLMLPSWLAAVAWAFATHPGYDVVYGARVLERERDTLPELPAPWKSFAHCTPHDRPSSGRDRSRQLPPSHQPPEQRPNRRRPTDGSSSRRVATSANSDPDVCPGRDISVLEWTIRRAPPRIVRRRT